MTYLFECHRCFDETSQEFWLDTILEEIEEDTVRYDDDDDDYDDDDDDDIFLV